MASTFDLMMQDAGPAQAGSVFGKMRADAGAPVLPPIAADPTDGMSTLDKLRAGVGKAMADIGRGVGQYIPTIQNGHLQPLVSRQDVADSNKLDAPLMATGAGTAGNIAGNLALAAPAAFIPGAASLPGAAAIGAAYGALQPSTSTSQTLSNVGMGAAGSAVVPGAMLAARAGKSLVEPLYQSGRNQIVGRALADASGGDGQALAQALRSNSSGVPGVQYTAAEAAGNPSIAALQRTASQINPVVMNESVTRQAANSQALASALQDAAGTQGKREFFDAARNAAANEQYGKAFSVAVEPENLSPAMRGEVTKLMGMPAIQDALKQARTNAMNYGMNIESTEGSIMGLHQAKLAMDDQINKLMGGTAAEVNKARAITAARDRLVTFMEKMSPDYNDARTTYAAMSKPLNEMDVVGQIAKSSTNPMTGALYPQSYARALSDDTARSVTGMGNATLESTLQPQTLAMLNDIKGDLARQQFAATAGRPVGSDTVQKLAYSNMLQQAGVPNFIRSMGPSGIVGSVLERGGNLLYADKNRQLSEQLARALLNPSQAADLLAATAPSQRALRYADVIKRLGTSLGSSTPALIQAGQQQTP